MEAVVHQQLQSPLHPSSSCSEQFSVLSSSICSEAQLQQESMQACCNNSEHGQHFASLLYSQSSPNGSSRQESFNYNSCRMSFSQNGCSSVQSPSAKMDLIAPALRSALRKK